MSTATPTPNSGSFSPPDDADLAPLARRGIEPDRYAIFRDLKRMFCERHPAGGTQAIADWCGVKRTAVVAWGTGSGGRSPAPWWVITRLTEYLGLVLVIDGSGAHLHQKP